MLIKHPAQKPNRNGRTHIRTDGQRENSISPTQFANGVDIISVNQNKINGIRTTESFRALTHLCLESYKRGIGKQCRSLSDAAKAASDQDLLCLR